MSDGGVIATTDPSGVRSQHLSQEPQAPLEPPWSRMPPEMWERILDLLWNEPRALRSCELVCKMWKARSRFHLDRFYMTSLSDTHVIRRLATWTREVPRYQAAFTEMIIRGDNGSSRRSSAAAGSREPDLAHVGAFAAMLVGLLPRLEELRIVDGSWPSSIPHTVLLHLTMFTSVTHLSLTGVSFPSVRTLCRLICALKGLRVLSTQSDNAVAFTDGRLPKRVLKRLVPPDLNQVEVYGRSRGIKSHSVGALYQALSATLPMSCQHLMLQEISLECIESSSIQQLLWIAGSTLLSLTISLPALTYHLSNAMGNGLHGPIGPLEAAGPLELVDRTLNLSRNKRLKKLWLHLPFPHDREYEFFWVPQFLSHIAPRGIEEISIEFGSFIVSRYSESLSGILRICCSIDDMLSHSKFIRLEHVYFNLIYDGSRGHNAWEQWLPPLWEELTLRWYPKLRNKGIIQACIKEAEPFMRLRPWTEIDWSDSTVLL